jgi:hypothetical protein
MRLDEYAASLPAARRDADFDRGSLGGPLRPLDL